MDQRRLADVRAGTAHEQRSGASGYLVGKRLVLTCRHVLADDEGTLWPRLEVWLGHPGEGPRRQVSADVAWVHPDQDAALLRIGDKPGTGGSPVRWGCFAGPGVVPYAGLGFPEFADYASGRGVEQLSGTVPPLGMGADGGLVLDQGPAPEATVGRAWPGVSGAAVFCQGLLTAVVTRDDLRFGNRRLHAVPVSALTGEPGFARLITEDTGTVPALEAVELAEFLQSPARTFLARTPGSLLAAAVEAAEFTGRGEELAELTAWRDSAESFSVMLIAGEGGQGKTRLARRFVAQAREFGWAAGFLAARAVVMAPADSRDQRQKIIELAGRAREATRPVLLVADYAETRPDEMASLADTLADSPPAHPVRLLLLSRTAGAWWTNLTEALGPHLTSQITLEPLTEPGHARRDAYIAAVTGLAQHLATLPHFAAEQSPGRPWSALADKLAAQSPSLDDPRLGNALALQIAALTSLLTAAAGQAPDASGENEFVRHERDYLRRAAAKRRLFDPGMLSDRADDSERAAEAWTALERALAGAILLGPCGTGKAQAIGALASNARAGDVVSWLAALYPHGDGLGVGGVQPDRLAELLLGPILTHQPALMDAIADLAEGTDDAYVVLFALMRTAAYRSFSQLGDHVVNLIASRPVPFAIAAPVLAAALPRPEPLRDGLLRVGRRDPEAFRQAIYSVLGQLPNFSVSGAIYSVALTREVVGILRQLATADPAAYLFDLATNLTDLAVRLADAGQRQAALAPSQEAVAIFRQLSEAEPGVHLPFLAVSLTNLGAHLAVAGQRQAAVATTQEAVTIHRQLAEAGPGADLPGLALALTNLGAHLAETGQRQAALAAAQEAVTIRRQLAEASPDAHLPELAMTLNNLGSRLAEAGQHQAALAPAQEAADIYRQLAEVSPDAYLPDLAMALTNLSASLADTGQWQAALAAAQEAVTIRRQLAETNPDAYLPDLAMALNRLGTCLADTGQWPAALAPAQEAVTISRQLAEASPDAHLPDLAGSLAGLGIRLAQTGQQQAAVVPGKEAADIYRQLAEASPDAYLPDLAMALNNLGLQMAEAGQREGALAAAQEAADTYRRLAITNPDAYLRDLAASLGNLGSRLAEAGQPQAALGPAQEAVGTYRRLAAVNPDALRPRLAVALNNLSAHLAKTGQRQAALAAAQEAVTIRRQLAEASPDAHLPELAMVLNNLGAHLAEDGQQQAALAAAQEAVTIRRRLAAASPGAYLRQLANSLTNLSARLIEADRGAEVGNVWQSAIASLPDEAARLALTVTYAAYLLDEPDPAAGVALLVRVLASAEAPGQVQADARRLLRGHWRQYPDSVAGAWQSQSTIPVPEWMHLTDEDLDTVISWINSGPWSVSRQYFREHSSQLLGDTTLTVLDELTLSTPDNSVDHYRTLLEDVRERGVDAAYRPLLAGELLRQWMAVPSWDASRTFLRDHPGLFDEVTLSLLAALARNNDPEIITHHALLTLAKSPESVDEAYESLEDVQLLQVMADTAIAARDPGCLNACAAIETFVHGHFFAGTLDLILSELLVEPAGRDSDEWTSLLPNLAAEAAPAETGTALARFQSALASIPVDEVTANRLRQILGLPDRA